MKGIKKLYFNLNFVILRASQKDMKLAGGRRWLAVAGVAGGIYRRPIFLAPAGSMLALVVEIQIRLG